MPPAHIRWMMSLDWPDVLAISEATPFPMTADELDKWLRRLNCIAMVAECGAKVVGFMIYELRKRRIELLYLAVASEMRGRGLGRQIVDTLKRKLGSNKKNQLAALVPESLLAVQKLLRSEGFKATAVVKARPEDAYRMEFWLDEPAAVEATNRIGAML